MNDKQNELFQSRSYQIGKQVKKYLDDYYLDGIIGLIPFLGSTVTHGFNLVYIYMAWFKLRSKRLTLVIIFNGLKDLVLGYIPILGTILDFFYKSNQKNLELIERFAANHEPTIRQVHKQAHLTILGIVALCVLAYGLVIFGVKLLAWVWVILF